MKLTHAYVGDFTYKRNEDGTLLVTGTATSPALDSDQQICDPRWLAKAMPKWAEVGNVREMHGKVAAGVGVEVSQSPGDKWTLTSLCVDPVTAKKIETGVLKGYSIGIRNAGVVKDAAAPGGRINKGDICEISYVDRGANPDANDLALVKIAKFEKNADDFDVELEDAETEDEPKATFAELLKRYNSTNAAAIAEATEVKSFDDLEAWLYKKAYTQAEREEMAKNGEALSDGSFPIKTVADLKNAIKAYGRAADKAKAMAHIKKRAEALGQSDLIPENWKAVQSAVEKVAGDASLSDETRDAILSALVKDDSVVPLHDPQALQETLENLLTFIQTEIDEMKSGENEIYDIQDLTCAVQIFLSWWRNEAWEGETVYPFNTGGPDVDIYAEMGVDAQIVKAAKADDATDEAKAALTAATAKALGLDTLIAESITKSQEEDRKTIEGLRADLDTVKRMATKGGPSLMMTEADRTRLTKSDELRVKIADKERLLSDPVLEAGDKALVRREVATLRAELSVLEPSGSPQ